MGRTMSRSHQRNAKINPNSKFETGHRDRSYRAGDKPKAKEVSSNIAKLLQKKKQMEDTGGDYIDEEEVKMSPNTRV